MDEDQKIIGEFRAEVAPYFHKVKERIAESLMSILMFQYPESVKVLNIDIFSDSFTSGSPMHLYILDGGNNECFFEGETLNRNIIDIDGVYPAQVEEGVLNRYPGFNTSYHASMELIGVFSKCFDSNTWNNDIDVLIGIHDSSERYDLVRGTWVDV